MNKALKSVMTLSLVALILGVLLASVNKLTGSVIADANGDATVRALREVYPKGESFSLVNISEYSGVPTSVREAYRADDGGCVIKLETSGYKSGLVIICGISKDGIVTGAKCLESQETLAAEDTYGAGLVGKDESGVMNAQTVSGATKTTQGYKNAIKDAFIMSKILDMGEEN